MPEPIHVLVRAARRAVEIQAGREPAAYIAGAPTVLRGAATHTGAYLLQALEEQGWTLAPKTVEPERPDFYYEGMDGHAVRLTVEDGYLNAALICPESGCSPGAQCGSCHRSFDDETEPCYDCKDREAPTECWLKSWFDECTPDELLCGKIEFVAPADVEFDGDHPVVTLQAPVKAANAEVEWLRAELRRAAYERDCWRADSGRLREELCRQATVRGGEQPEPVSDGLTLFRAVGLHPQLGTEPIGLGGLRHTRDYADRDAEAALSDGWTEAWVETATWRRVAALEGGEQHGTP